MMSHGDGGSCNTITSILLIS